ncbi:ATP-dependent DNA helicase [Trichonephila clavipes]|nr:ATP-dependent DNA helicase [Trichonephila clavipes]
MTPDQIDQIISAEIPDKHIDPNLFDVVTKNMIHGPCGAFNSNSSCIDVLGRLYTVHPNNTECFYLRLLLINIRGPISFQDLRTINGQLSATYRQAFEELNLLENDAHWDTALADASNTARPQQIRTLFAIILTTCFPSNPKDLWEKYKDYMSEDILHRLRAANQNPTFNSHQTCIMKH